MAGVLTPTDIAHDFSLHAAGINANAKDGGLRLDLSLAFEGEDDDFNKFLDAQGYETEDISLNNLSYSVNYLYEESADTRSIRGPTWQLLRNHYRTYQEVTNNATAPTIRARATFPNTQQQWDDSLPNSWKKFMDEYNLIHSLVGVDGNGGDIFTVSAGKPWGAWRI